jgi:hypothetical protein
VVVRGRLALRAAGRNSRAPREPFKQKSRATLLGAFHRASAQQRHPQLTARHANPSTKNEGAHAQQRHPQPTAGHANPPTEIQGDVVGGFPPRKRPTTSPSTNRGPREPTDKNPGRRCWGTPTAQVPNNVTLNYPRATRTLQQETRAQTPNNVKPESAPPSTSARLTRPRRNVARWRRNSHRSS